MHVGPLFDRGLKGNREMNTIMPRRSPRNRKGKERAHADLWVATIKCANGGFLTDPDTDQLIYSVFETSTSYPIEYDSEHPATKQVRKKLHALVRKHLGVSFINMLNDSKLHETMMITEPESRIAYLELQDVLGAGLTQSGHACGHVQGMSLRLDGSTIASGKSKLAQDTAGDMLHRARSGVKGNEQPIKHHLKPPKRHLNLSAGGRQTEESMTKRMRRWVAQQLAEENESEETEPRRTPQEMYSLQMYGSPSRDSPAGKIHALRHCHHMPQQSTRSL